MARRLTSIAIAAALSFLAGCSSDPASSTCTDCGPDGGGPAGSAADGGDGGGAEPDPNFGKPGYGGGDVSQAPCVGHVNPPGAPMITMAWPSASNGNQGEFAGFEGQGIRFEWNAGSHNVLQIDSWSDHYHPSPSFSDPKFPRGIRSGEKVGAARFDWSWGSFPCGYRPGLYYFVDEGSEASGIVATAITVEEDQKNHFHQPKECSTLADPEVYGGRYSAYATRADCHVFEVNNFQTEAHYDWVPATFYGRQAKQGDLVLFRWTNFHNVVQVHDVRQDDPVPGGITSGKKTECVGGPSYSCANGPPLLGEYMIDTADYRPGILHFSDEDIMTDHATGKTCESCPGMNQQFMLEYRRPKPPRSCCELPGASGKYSTQCRVIEEYNDQAGAQFTYQIGAGRGDVVRFRWAGALKIQQVEGGSSGPGTTPKPGGLGMASSIECVPGPKMTCLNGTTDQAQLIVDVKSAIDAKTYDSDGSGAKLWYFRGLGENKEGWTSSDTGVIVYVDDGVPYDANAPKCP